MSEEDADPLFLIHLYIKHVSIDLQLIKQQIYWKALCVLHAVCLKYERSCFFNLFCIGIEAFHCEPVFFSLSSDVC